VLRRLGIAFVLTARELLRRPIVLLLLFLVPAVFVSVILAVTRQTPISFQISAIEEEDYLRVPERAEALVFIGLAAVGVLAAFVALHLAQRDSETMRRLVLCGYRPLELLAARLGVLALTVSGIALLVAMAMALFFRPQSLALMFVGFAVLGWVYACYGLLVGTLLRQELEGVLFVALLANLDIGWLQNPIYYAHAQQQVVIRSLPGYLPSQVAMAAAFSEHTAAEILRPALLGFVYGAVLLLLAVLGYARRLRA